MIDLKLWLVYGCIVAYYSLCFMLGEMYQSIKHQGKKLALLIERRKLAKKTRRQLTREDAEFFRDVKKMRSDEYAKACRARAKTHDDERRAVQASRNEIHQKNLAMEREALQRERRKEAAFLDGVVLPDELRSRVLQLSLIHI